MSLGGEAATPVARRVFWERLVEKTRAIPGVKKVLIASGVRYDLAMEGDDSSGWGIVAILMHLTGALITMFTQIDPFSTSTVLRHTL